MAFVNGFGGKLVAVVGAEAIAVGDVVERAVQEVHAEDYDIASAKRSGSPFDTEYIDQFQGIAAEVTFGHVVVGIGRPVGAAQEVELVGPGAEGEGAHVERQVVQGSPDCVELLGAGAMKTTS